MSGAVTIRVATPEDADAITRVYMDSAEHHADIDPERHHVPARLEIVERYRSGRQHPESGAPSITLVAETAGAIAGFIDAQLQQPFDAMYRPATYCFIADIAVARGHRSQGIGEKLMEAAEHWGREQGADYLSLEYHIDNRRAADFYARLGFRGAAVKAVKAITAHDI